MKKFILIYIIVLGSKAAFAQLPTTAEYNALMDLYNSTNGPNWTNKNGWSTANPNVVQSVEGWWGITVNAQGHIVELSFQSNNLVGSIPSSIGNLSYVDFINLGFNHLSGPIPSSLGSLTNLFYLYLGGNQLSGPIPSQLGNLANLQYLYLQSNNLSGSFPPELGALNALKELCLHYNDLSGPLPSSIGMLSNLRLLVLFENQLSGSIPTEIGNLTNLIHLELTGNQLSGPIPASIGSLTNLSSLYLRQNQLSGSIPSTLGNLTSLEYLYLNDNNLSEGISTSLGNLTNLKHLYLHHNSLSGSIPEFIGSLGSLILLDLSYNDFSGSIPVEIGNLQNLSYLELSRNELTGTIPTSLGNLSSLRDINLGWNQLRGPIPQGWSSLANLFSVNLTSNYFTFSDFIQFKQQFTNIAFLGQGLVDEEKLLEGTLGESFVLTTTIDRNTNPASVYRWYKKVNGVSTLLNTPSTSGHSYTLSSLSDVDLKADYFYTITNPAALGLTLTSRVQKITPKVSSGLNFVRTIDLTVEGKKTENEVLTAPITQRMISYAYFDGLGRAIQKVNQQASPTRSDVIQPIVYDQYGREAFKYLPYTSGNDGSYKTNPVGLGSPQQQFYNNDSPFVAQNDAPYTETIFEAGPLNRVFEQGAPGAAWQPSTDRSIKKEYQSNTEEQVLLFEYNADNGDISAVDNGELQYYLANELIITKTIDEHQNEVIEFTDKEGKVVLKQVQYGTVGSATLYANTYYIYDHLNNLVVVLPPEGVKEYLKLVGQQQ